MIDIGPREPVILADEFETLVSWYKDALGFVVVKRFDEGYRYCNLEAGSGFRIGIAPAKDMGVVPGDRSRNTVVLQLEVEDVRELFDHLKSVGGSVAFGPTFNEKDRFWFGAFRDPEENPWWVVDRNCP